MKQRLMWIVPAMLATSGMASVALAQDVPPPPPADAAAIPPPPEAPMPPTEPVPPPPPVAAPAPIAAPPPQAGPETYPVCSKTVTDNCINPSERPRGKAKAKPRR